MKKVKLILLMILFSTTGLWAQTSYNPFTQNIHFEPEPTVFGFECGSTPNVEFTQGLTTSADATDWANNPLVVTICITGFEFDGATAASVVSGSYSTNFSWAFDTFAPNCLIGTQSQTLPGTGSNPLAPNPLSTGDINIALSVPETSPQSTVLAVNVNLQVPGYMSTFNSTPDDNESTQTQTFCDLKIDGTVYYDSTKTDNSFDRDSPFGTPNGAPLFVFLVDDVTGDVVGIDTIDANDGTYEFLNVTPNSTYEVVLSSDPGVIGNPPPAFNIPTYVTTGEDCCDMLGDDGTPDGTLTVVVTNASVENADFGISPEIPTPVEMASFELSEYNCNTLVTWATATEENVSHFEIMRMDKTTGSFVKIAKVAAAGNSSSDKMYSYVDKDVEKSNEKYLYTIKTVDIDASEQYSEVKSIRLTCDGDISSAQIFPNPASAAINLVYTTDENDIQLVVDVLDITGRKLLSKSQIVYKGTSVVNMDIKSLAVGQYLIRYTAVESNKTSSIKFTKE